MTIQEQLNKMNSTFEKLHHDFTSFAQAQSGLEAKYNQKVAGVRAKWQVETGRLNQQKDEVLKFYRIAKDSSRRELSSGAMPLQPNPQKLNQMIERVDGNNRTDPIAGQIIDLCSSYVAFIDKELSLLAQKENTEIQDVNRDKDKETRNLKERKKQVLQSCEKYLHGEDISQLVSLFEGIHNDYEITPDYFEQWGKNPKRKRMMLIGFSQYPVDVPSLLTSTLKASLGKHFDERTKMVNCPFGYTLDTHEDIYWEYIEKNEDLMKQGVQALILNYLRYFRPSEYKVNVLDYIHYSADVLGPMYVLLQIKNGIFEKVPADAKELRLTISMLAQYYRKVEVKIGASTVFEYNKSHAPGERIPYRLLILNRDFNPFRNDHEPEMLFLLNNAAKFGIATVRLSRSLDGGSKGKDREKKYLVNAKDAIHIISEQSGAFYIENDIQWLRFQPLTSVSSVPDSFVSKLSQILQPTSIGTKYFKRYPMTVPQKQNKRRPISVPFAIDEDDNVISCSFENETFAAYIMGAAGSGKSTLLHTIISGLLMNYHPDEVELWLLDFKMLEFKRYVDCMPPHVKYILLEKSEDLVFDIIDRLTSLLDERQYVFSQNKWFKLTDVPIDQNIPAIFIIIDEFAQMSQILKETKGLGYGSDYTIKLENLLAKGRALGIKFIFASQSYTTGISGLTDTACKQIQTRFAMKNTAEEIKQTLALSGDQITPEINTWIYSLPAFETLFKWRNEDGEVHTGRFRNMYTENGEIENLIGKINQVYRPVPNGSKTDSTTYIDKKPVTIDGGQPKTFKSQVPLIEEYRKTTDLSDMDDSDSLIFPGTPCSFNPVHPFKLIDGISENILIVGSDRENKLSILLSLLNSNQLAHRFPVEIWSHDRSTIFKKYKSTVLARYKSTTDLDEICSKIAEVRQSVEGRMHNDRIIVVMGYEMLASDMEILGADTGNQRVAQITQAPDPSVPDMSEVLERIKQCSDPAEKKRILDEYNAKVKQQSSIQQSPSPASSGIGIYDARQDLEWALKRAPNYGTHFIFCFDQPKDFISTRINEKSFQHKLLFAMAKDDALNIAGNRKANEIEEGICLYTDGKTSFTMRPHLYRGVPCNGWMVDENGNILQQKGGGV